MNWRWIKYKYFWLIGLITFCFGMIVAMPTLIESENILDLGFTNIGAFFFGSIAIIIGIICMIHYESELKKMKELKQK